MFPFYANIFISILINLLNLIILVRAYWNTFKNIAFHRDVVLNKCSVLRYIFISFSRNKLFETALHWIFRLKKMYIFWFYIILWIFDFLSLLIFGANSTTSYSFAAFLSLVILYKGEWFLIKAFIWDNLLVFIILNYR
jgi:hypothetical protein